MDAEKARQIRRRWFLPIYLVALIVWVVVWGLDLTVGGGLRGPADALQFVITGLVVGIGLLGEWLVRREDPRGRQPRRRQPLTPSPTGHETPDPLARQ